MRRLTFLTAAVLGLLLWGPTPPRVEAGEARLYFVGVLHDGRQVRGQEFPAGSLRELLIVVEYRHLAGTRTQRLDLYTPGGALYRQLTTEVTLAGQGRPVATGASRPDRGKSRGRTPAPAWGERVETRLPVGGTWITEFSLFGAWRVDVYLDQERMPITTSEVFILTP
jgi:hypothetical protein